LLFLRVINSPQKNNFSLYPPSIPLDPLLLANLSVKEIAFELGFTEISHVSRWFSNLEGVAPMEWKKKYAG
ncbi:helix-turn-helix domain-containing protein, partial [Arcticibacter tournemirensis]|uniref:helix-turn-helix domain-containing protein n=1 Tax=Arcticibacter tournemirensis TaxID=699437 RepID=UPI001F414B6B